MRRWIKRRYGPYVKDAVARMQKAGNRFNPQGTATRAQVAVIMQNLCEKNGK